jgi:tetratricopeptide (TPR) repeat protein
MENDCFTLAEARLHFAVDFHSKTWELLDKSERTQDEDERMVDYAHASLAHWRSAGTAVRHQRGEWMLARVYAVVGEPKLALKHAYRCAEILQSNSAEMRDFDFAFSYEAVARAYAASGDRAEAERFLQKALEAGNQISESEDREVFFSELRHGPWHGVEVP